VRRRQLEDLGYSFDEIEAITDERADRAIQERQDRASAEALDRMEAQSKAEKEEQTWLSA
jgi:DNA-binding transcriptional MerR regulator